MDMVYKTVLDSQGDDDIETIAQHVLQLQKDYILPEISIKIDLKGTFDKVSINLISYIFYFCDMLSYFSN